MAKYSKEFKREAIRLSNEIGSKKAAAQLGIPYYTLADWRNNSKHPAKEIESLSSDELMIRNRELERENMELREANNTPNIHKEDRTEEKRNIEERLYEVFSKYKLKKSS